jgi:hypothetical protein
MKLHPWLTQAHAAQGSVTLVLEQGEPGAVFTNLAEEAIHAVSPRRDFRRALVDTILDTQVVRIAASKACDHVATPAPWLKFSLSNTHRTPKKEAHTSV